MTLEFAFGFGVYTSGLSLELLFRTHVALCPSCLFGRTKHFGDWGHACELARSDSGVAYIVGNNQLEHGPRNCGPPISLKSPSKDCELYLFGWECQLTIVHSFFLPFFSWQDDEVVEYLSKVR